MGRVDKTKERTKYNQIKIEREYFIIDDKLVKWINIKNYGASMQAKNFSEDEIFGNSKQESSDERPLIN